MSKSEDESSFWTKKKKYAVTEVLMYLVMIIGIAIGIMLLS